MAGILTKGITLSYKQGEAGEYTVLENLMSIPEIGNGVPEKIDVTVLTDNVKKSIAGLGDSAQDLAFQFLYEKTQFETLIGLNGVSCDWRVSMPDGVTADFKAAGGTRFDSAAPNAALTYTLNLVVESEITFGTGA